MLPICSCKVRKPCAQSAGHKQITARPIVAAQSYICIHCLVLRGVDLHESAESQKTRKRVVSPAHWLRSRKVTLRKADAIPGFATDIENRELERGLRSSRIDC